MFTILRPCYYLHCTEEESRHREAKGLVAAASVDTVTVTTGERLVFRVWIALVGKGKTGINRMPQATFPTSS